MIRNYVLVDLRDKNERNVGFIQESISIPAVEIKRDRIPNVIYDLKNEKNTLIIVYSSNDRDAIATANHLYEKGYDNIYLLTGGI